MFGLCPQYAFKWYLVHLCIRFLNCLQNRMKSKILNMITQSSSNFIKMFCTNHLKSFEDSDSHFLEWGLRFWLSTLFPGSIWMMLVGPWTTFCNIKSTGLSVVPFIPAALTLLLASYDLSCMALYHGFVHSILCSNCLQSTMLGSMKLFPEAYRVRNVFIIIVKHHLPFSSSSFKCTL